MKITKVLINTLAIGITLAGIISLSSCQIPGMGNTPDTGDGNVHTHELAFVSGMDATCNAEGIEDYYECEGCNKLFADENGETEITTPKKISKTDHNEVVIPAKPSTCTQDGSTEGKKCGTCGKILQAPENIAHVGFVLNGEHICYDTLDSHGVEGLIVSYADGVYTISGENAVISSIEVENITLNIAGGIAVTCNEEGVNAIYARNAELNFVAGETTVNGFVFTESSWLTIDNNSTLSIIGGNLYTKGDVVEDADYEFGNRHRLYVRYGTLNIDCDIDGEAALYSNSIMVGSIEEKLNGYINIHTTTGDGIKLKDEIVSRYMFAKGEIICTGGVTDGTSTAAAINCNFDKTKYIDIMKEMTITAINYQDALRSEMRWLYIGLTSTSVVCENTPNAINSLKNYIRVYSQEELVVQYTDAEGKTGLARLRFSGDTSLVTFYAKAYADLSFVPLPTEENYTEWKYKVEFLGWVE